MLFTMSGRNAQIGNMKYIILPAINRDGGEREREREGERERERE